MSEREMKAGSVFSGIGGGDLGMELAGIRTIWQIEDAKFPRRILETRWPEVRLYHDVTTIDPAELEPVDVLHGGFPCQDVSVAGRRAGMDGERSSLFFEFARLAAALRPRWVVIENVPGLRSSPGWDNGRDMALVIRELAQLGYMGGYRSLDAQYFGLAQRRERVFFVGHLGDGARALEVLFERGGSPRDPEAGGGAGTGIAFTLTGRSGVAGSPERSGGNAGGFRTEPGVFPDLRRHDERHRGTDKLRDKPSLNTDNNDLLLAPPPNGRDTAFALRQDPGGVGQGWNTNYVTPVAAPLRTNDSNNSDGGTDALAKIYEPMGIRKLTPLECERLQGFPDGWTCLCDAGGVTALCTCPDSPRYRALGNAIPVPVFAWIARRIVDVHNRRENQSATQSENSS